MTVGRDRLPVSLNGRNFAIDLAGYRRVSIDPQRAMVDQSGDVGEQTLMQPGQWKRTGYDWRDGAGQQLFDADDETNRRRFRSSLGVNPWDPRYLILHKAVEEAQDDGHIPPGYGGRWPDKMVRYRNGLYFSGNKSYATTFASSPGSNLYYVAADDHLTRPWGLDTTDSLQAFGYEISDMAVVGSKIILCEADDSIWHYTGTELFGGARTHVIHQYTTDNRLAGAPVDHRMVTGCRNRIITGGRAGLQEVIHVSNNVCTTDVIDSWTSGTRQVTCLEGAPMGVFVGFRNGQDDNVLIDSYGRPEANEIGLITIDDTDTSLTAPTIEAQLPDGERINCLLYNLGFLVVGTTKGFHIAQVASDGSLTLGSLVEIDDGETSEWEQHRGVLSLYGQGQYVWFGWANPDGSRTGIGRMDLARFTSPLVPAYATDLMTPTADAKSGQVTAITELGDRLYLMVNKMQGYSTTASDFDTCIYGETLNYVPSGTLNTGRISFGTAETKRFTALEVAADPLPAGATIVGDIAEPDGTTTQVVSMSTTDDTYERGEISGVGGEWVEVQLELTRPTDATTTPKLDRWTLRGIPVPDRIEEIWLPIMISNTVRHEPGPDVGLDPWTEFAWLKALLESREVVPLTMGSESLSVYVDGLYTGDGGSRLSGWTLDETWVEGTWLVKVVTVPDGSSTVIPVSAATSPPDADVITHGLSYFTDLYVDGALAELAKRAIDVPSGAFALATGSPALANGFWLFDPSSAESISALVRTPDEWTTCNVKLLWYGTAAGNVKWQATFADYDVGESVLAPSTSNSGNATTAAGSVAALVETTISGLTCYGGDLAMLEIKRLAADGGDTNTGDAALAGIVLEWAS